MSIYKFIDPVFEEAFRKYVGRMIGDIHTHELDSIRTMVLEFNGETIINSLDDLKSFNNLNSLIIKGGLLAKVSSLRFPNLSHLNGLEKLSLMNINISNLDSIKDISYIKNLYISFLRSKDFGFLKYVRGVNTLSINKCDIDDYLDLGNYTSLTELFFEGGSITSVVGVENLRNLEKLFISKGTILNPSFFSKLNTSKLNSILIGSSTYNQNKNEVVAIEKKGVSVSVDTGPARILYSDPWVYR